LSDTPSVFAAPVILFGFNRPDYLRRVCLSLRAQRRRVVEDRQVWLVQDGAVSPRSGVRYAEDAAIAASVTAFREVFPGGQMLEAQGQNFGIAENIRRGEDLAFQALGAEWALFLEDDLELGPDYLEVIERIAELAAPFPQVGYFAAYGDHRLAEPPTRIGWQPLEHNWGFALRRAAWARIRPLLEPYHAILARTDYRYRLEAQIHEWQGRLAHASDRSSQDAMKAVACAELGIARVMTNAVFARYIGAEGASFNPRKFAELGYDRTAVVTLDSLDFAPLDEAVVAGLVGREQARLAAFRRERFDGFLASMQARFFDPRRTPSREDVEGLYRLLLDRLPENEQVYEHAMGRHSLASLRRAIMNSNEFRGRNPAR
jgi:hypothetical protein